MTLEELKYEYVNSITSDNTEDHEQLINEIYEADDLEEFIRVAEVWANDRDKIGIGKLILKRIITE